MKIILKEDITNLGYKDDVVEVKNGYGRNYLIPQGKAVIASESALKVLAENQRQRAHKLAKIKADAEAYYNRTISASLSPLIIQEDWIEKWDGKLPSVQGGENMMPVINMKK